jgi:hypothetical protein
MIVEQPLDVSFGLGSFIGAGPFKAVVMCGAVPDFSAMGGEPMPDAAQK